MKSPLARKPVERDWTAVRRGEIYCAPACGFNCTYAAYRAAIQKGKALAKRCGQGYTYHVWENMGWYYNAVSPCGRLKVHEHKDVKQYLAFLGEPDFPGGSYTAWGETPKESIALVIAVTKAHLAKIGGLITGFAG